MAKTVTKSKINLVVAEIEKKNYHLFLPVCIGREKCFMLVDTGASKTVFDSVRVLRFVKPKQLLSPDIQSVGLGSRSVHTQIATLKALRFGMMKVSKMEVAVLDLSHVNKSYKLLGLPQIDGVLGSDFLMKFKAVINFEKKKLSLKR